MSSIRITVDIDDFIDEIDTDDLISELEIRDDLPKEWEFLRTESDKIDYGRTPRRNAIINYLGLHECATLEDMQEAIKDIYNNLK